MARFLLVDDSSFIRDTLGKILDEMGHTIVASVSNGVQAILEYQKHRPDVVTMDIILPCINGIETIEEIFSNFPEAKIIVVSASKDMIFHAIERGAKQYILKPFYKDKVIDTINSVLNETQSQDNYEINPSL